MTKVLLGRGSLLESALHMPMLEPKVPYRLVHFPSGWSRLPRDTWQSASENFSMCDKSVKAL